MRTPASLMLPGTNKDLLTVALMRATIKTQVEAVANVLRVFDPAELGTRLANLGLHRGLRGARNKKASHDCDAFLKWAYLGSNQGPLPCEGSALPLSYMPL